MIDSILENDYMKVLVVFEPRNLEDDLGSAIWPILGCSGLLPKENMQIDDLE